MPETPTALQKLIQFLDKLFQFESQDLDFGIYKILNYKRKEVKQFIDRLLVDEVKKQLEVFDKEVTEKLAEEIARLEKDEMIASYLTALAKNPEEAATIRKYSPGKIDKYDELKRQVDDAQKINSTEDVVYNHLTLFFSRYYDKGDFISKRRFGKAEKYVVPYNGEETHFYWANHDQYYVKSTENFQKFAFKIKHSSGTLTVNFKLVEAKTELGNVKADENKYFILSAREPELQGDELNIFFEFRPLTEEEKKSLSGNSKQDQLNEDAAQKLQTNLKRQILTAELWKQDENGASFLLRKLHHYTRKNSYDFFIHKDLKGFLRRELDFYIKSELVKVDDLYVLDSVQHFENIRHNIKLIKCFKNIADTIIDFLTQIEDFQKKLWEKKKFVLSTEWVITIDKLAAWLGKKDFEEQLTNVLKNKKQLEEWKQLFGGEVLPKWRNLKEDDLKDETGWKKLPVDTANFSSDFKTSLLTMLSEKIDLEEESNGLIIHSDNFHGLSLLQEKLNQQVKCTYIDPPYNTSASEIIYKNGYKSSSWLSLIADRLISGKNLLKNDGILCLTIDDFEVSNVSHALETLFGSENHLGTVVIRSNPSGRPTPQGFAIAHEYALFYSNLNEIEVDKLTRGEHLRKRYKEQDENGNFMWELLRKRGSNSRREDARKSFFAFAVNTELKARLPESIWDETKQEWKVNKKDLKKDEVLVWPIDENGVERNWRWGWDTAKKNSKDLRVTKSDDGVYTVYYKFREPKGVLATTNWIDAKYSATEHGTGLVKQLFEQYQPFSYPKSLYAVEDCLRIGGLKDLSGYCIDYFAGSGTTFHATQSLNREDDGNRKCVLIEQGSYTYTIILPRIKKVAFSFTWKEGKPEAMNGLGVFIKYHRLEQYEETLENIQFTASEETMQQALQLDTYMPKYFLNFETRGSNTFVNIAAMQDPWNYKLRVWDGFTYDTEQAVDLIETFNYLIGLHMQKYMEREHKGTRYAFVWGRHNDEKKSLIVWRTIKGWKQDDYNNDRLYLEEELKKFDFDHLYINGQATLLQKYQLTEDVFKTKMIPA